ncbi:MAG: hypothetical protein IJX89_00820 [Alphaproteobacteria bacterium]|nr:hypothetical protein [Alphaproteobacteria bacterium]
MFGKKQHIIVGLTTFNNENLAISVPGLGKIRKKFDLVIYNDNPNTNISARQIRKHGYRGKLHVINGATRLGTLGARLAILDAIKNKNIHGDWIEFVDDDDVLLNLDLPRVGNNNFAIIQNMVVMRTRLVDVLRIMKNPNDYQVDNENVFLVRPHIGMAGTIVRLDIMQSLGNTLRRIMPDIVKIMECLSFRAPIDAAMWSWTNIYARHLGENYAPVYMDRVNYIATDIDTAENKYGIRAMPAKDMAATLGRVIEMLDKVLRNALADAAPAGQEQNA